MKKLIFICTASLFFMGCSGNVKNVQCKAQNWNELGYNAGQTGKSVRSFDQYRDGCGSQLEDGAMNAYLDGYMRGVAEFCTYENGYAQGYTKKVISDVCPAEMRTAYEKGHKAGTFDLNMRIQNVREQNTDKGMSKDVEEMEIFNRNP